MQGCGWIRAAVPIQLRLPSEFHHADPSRNVIIPAGGLRIVSHVDGLFLKSDNIDRSVADGLAGARPHPLTFTQQAVALTVAIGR